MRYRRSRAKGATFFFTVVTNNRRPILCEESNIALLRKALADVMSRHPFRFDAFVLLPDHLHGIWTLPENDNDFSTRWRLIKSYFSRHCSNEYKSDQTIGHKNGGDRQFGSIAIGNIRSETTSILSGMSSIYITIL